MSVNPIVVQVMDAMTHWDALEVEELETLKLLAGEYLSQAKEQTTLPAGSAVKVQLSVQTADGEEHTTTATIAADFVGWGKVTQAQCLRKTIHTCMDEIVAHLYGTSDNEAVRIHLDPDSPAGM